MDVGLAPLKTLLPSYVPIAWGDTISGRKQLIACGHYFQ